MQLVSETGAEYNRSLGIGFVFQQLEQGSSDPYFNLEIAGMNEMPPRLCLKQGGLTANLFRQSQLIVTQRN